MRVGGAWDALELQPTLPARDCLKNKKILRVFAGVLSSAHQGFLVPAAVLER